MFNKIINKITKSYLWLSNNYYRFLIIFLVFLAKGKFIKFDKKETGINILLCHKDVPLALVALTSLFYSTKHRFPIFIIDDGTMTNIDKKIFNEFFETKILSSSEEHKKIKSLKKTYPNLHNFLLNKNIPIYRKKIELIIFSPFKKYILLDSDILFEKYPTTLMNWINSNKLICYTSALNDSFNNHIKKYIDPTSFTKKVIIKDLSKEENINNIIAAIITIPDTSLINLKKTDSLIKKIHRKNYLFYNNIDEIIIGQMINPYTHKRLNSNLFFLFIKNYNHLYKFKLTGKEQAIHFAGTDKSEMVKKSLEFFFRILFQNFLIP